MSISCIGHLTAAWGTHNKTFLDQKRLVDFLYGFRAFGNCGGYGSNSHWATLEFFDYCSKDSVVHFIQSVGVHIEGLKTEFCNFDIDLPIAFNLCKIANPS